jgi:hypothetical protein
MELVKKFQVMQTILNNQKTPSQASQSCINRSVPAIPRYCTGVSWLQGKATHATGEICQVAPKPKIRDDMGKLLVSNAETLKGKLQTYMASNSGAVEDRNYRVTHDKS